MRYCAICGRPAHPHEIVTRGSGGPREPWNVIDLCDDHHTLGADSFHRLGRYSFAKRWPQFSDKIKAACERMGRVFDKEGKE
jgi:hypothetical protein